MKVRQVLVFVATFAAWALMPRADGQQGASGLQDAANKKTPSELTTGSCSGSKGSGAPGYNWESDCKGPAWMFTKSCLSIADVVLRGTIADDSGQMVAVATNARNRSSSQPLLFLRENSVLFNGQVEKITNGSVVFCEYAARADTHHQVTVAVVDPLLKPTANGTRVKLSPNAKRSPTVQPPGSCTSGIYTGKSFDFHLKALNIVDFFGLINELTGLNYILDSSVKGSVALEADIPWDQALALALKNNRLECKLYGHVLRVATLETLGTEGNHPDSTILKQTKCIPGGSNNMPIGIHVRDIAISDFFHFIHEESHLNVIVDPSVNDTLTMDVNERWDQLLDLVVRSKGLRCELEGDTLRIVALQR